MKASYQGNTKPYVLALYLAGDEAAVMPVLGALDARGLNLCYGAKRTPKRDAVRRACAVLAFLSEASVSDEGFETAMLAAKADGTPLICVNLDDTPLPDAINQLIFATNIISAARYPEPEELAERLMTAEALKSPAITKAQKPATRRLALILLAGALVIVAVAALLLFRRFAPAETEVVEVVEQAPVPDVAGLLGAGMTEEDLKSITELYLVGDTRVESDEIEYNNWHEIIVDSGTDDEKVWRYDGEAIPRGSFTDLSLIGRMENLRILVLVNQSVTDIGPLANLKNLKNVEIFDCPVDSIEAFSGMQTLEQVDLHLTRVTDLSPLAGCVRLDRFTHSSSLAPLTSLDGLGIASLKELEIHQASDLADISALSACGNLQELWLRDANNLSDISALSGCTSLRELEITDARALTNMSALGALTNLKALRLAGVGARDLSALGAARGLEQLELNDVPVRDLSFTSGMEKLRRVETHDTELRELNFLKELGVSNMNLSFSGNITDYSGLAAILKYEYLHVNPYNGNLAAALPYIQEAQFEILHLYDCRAIDFAALPPNIEHLHITSGALQSLEGLSVLPKLRFLQLENMNYLGSLDGLQDCALLRELNITYCQRLADIEALYAKRYTSLELVGLLTLPDLSRLQLKDGDGGLVLDAMPALTDLDPLAEAIDWLQHLELRDMEGVTDLSPLERMHVSHLQVPEHLAEQAELLLEEEFIDSFEVWYPEEWRGNDGDDDGDFILLSLDELHSLPDALLARVSNLTLVGDRIVDRNAEELNEEWVNDEPVYSVIDRATGEKTPVGPGVIESFDQLAKLTGLRELYLYDQPLMEIGGIQALGGLRWLEIRKCPLTDASPAFTLTELEGLNLQGTQVSSIQGVQNLTRLRWLSISDTQVADLSPLAACDFSEAYEEGGLELMIGNIPCEDFSALAAIERYRSLFFNTSDAALWLPHIAGKPVDALEAINSSLTNEQIKEIAALPGLRELNLSWNASEELTDLSPLLACETLERLVLSDNMPAALASIEGKAHFAVEVW